MKNEIYLAALLYDVLLLLEYSGNNQEQRTNEVSRVDKILNLVQFQSSNSKENKKEEIYKIIECSSKLAYIQETKAKQVTSQILSDLSLHSIFTKIYEGDNEIGDSFVYDFKTLNLQNIFPEPNLIIDKNRHASYLKELKQYIKNTENEIQLYYLLQKYLWCVPLLKEGVRDISLFDHIKTTAAIAFCLYNQYDNGGITKEAINNFMDVKEEQFILINGDISGIQDFIFNIPSKGAAKSLKAHSVYVSILSDIVTRYILDQLDLKEANLLYSGGGNFYILAPAYQREKITNIRNKILSNLLQAHDGELYFAIEYITLTPKDFKDFSLQWNRVKEKVNDLKQKKWMEIGLQEHFQNLFGPHDKGVKEGKHCEVCGVAEDIRALKEYREDTGEGQISKFKICSLCESYIELTNKLKVSNYYSISGEAPTNLSVTKECNDVFKLFGYRIDFLEKIKDKDPSSLVFKINDTEFLDEKCDGFKFGAYKLPMKAEGQVIFKELAETAKGDKKLAVLKLDVDNLGSIFNSGFRENKSIARVTALSRMMGLYFEGYINELIKKNKWENQLYVVFSGGDDTFIIGAWNIVLDFTKQFYHDFREYTCRNSKITFSAGIGIFPYNYPMVRSAMLSEEALEEAKLYRRKRESIPMKNKISFLGEVFSWEEFKRIEKLKKTLVSILEDYKTHDGSENLMGRNFLYKLEKSTIGFRKLLEKSTKGEFDNIRFWRLAYYLREVKAKDEKKAEEIIQEYKSILLNNLLSKNTEEKVENIMIIPAAIRWAQLETREGDINEGTD